MNTVDDTIAKNKALIARCQAQVERLETAFRKTLTPEQIGALDMLLSYKLDIALLEFSTVKMEDLQRFTDTMSKGT